MTATAVIVFVVLAVSLTVVGVNANGAVSVLPGCGTRRAPPAPWRTTWPSAAIA